VLSFILFSTAVLLSTRNKTDCFVLQHPPSGNATCQDNLIRAPTHQACVHALYEWRAPSARPQVDTNCDRTQVRDGFAMWEKMLVMMQQCIGIIRKAGLKFLNPRSRQPKPQLLARHLGAMTLRSTPNPTRAVCTARRLQILPRHATLTACPPSVRSGRPTSLSA
jgi:hypothetical protein